MVSHGYIRGRRAMLEILESRLEGVDPYNNMTKLIRLDSSKLIVDGKKFEPRGTPKRSYGIIDLSRVRNICFSRACKGVQRAAKGG